MGHKHTVVVSCFEDQAGFKLYCEPDGAELEVQHGDVLTITFETASHLRIELSRVSDGIVLGQYNDGEVPSTTRQVAC